MPSVQLLAFRLAIEVHGLVVQQRCVAGQERFLDPVHVGVQRGGRSVMPCLTHERAGQCHSVIQSCADFQARGRVAERTRVQLDLAHLVRGDARNVTVPALNLQVSGLACTILALGEMGVVAVLLHQFSVCLAGGLHVVLQRHEAHVVAGVTVLEVLDHPCRGTLRVGYAAGLLRLG